MSLGKLLQNVGWAALAAAITITAVPASARPNERDLRDVRAARAESQARPSSAVQARTQIAQRVNREQRAARVDRRSEQRAERIDRRSEQRANRIDRGTERRADRVERRGDQRAEWARQQGDRQRARQIERRSEQRAERIERRGDQRAERVERRGDQRANRVERRGDWRADRVDNRTDRRSWQRDRNRTYADRDRNRTYDRRWNDNDRRWRDNDRRWDRRWRDNNRYDWQRYRNSNRVVFRLGTYYSPYRNYSYRRVGIGGFLDSLFFGSRYWINDPWQYRLPEVYGPYRWVRYYDDVLLVDIYSGEVVDVIYDFFW